MRHKKPMRSALLLAVVLALALMLSACGGQPQAGTSTGAPSSQAAGSSLPVSSPAPSVPAGDSSGGEAEVPTEELQAAVVAQMNDFLAKYADGTYPQPVQYETEPGYVNHVPAGVQLPEQATLEGMAVNLSHAVGENPENAWYVEATLPLEQDYAMQYSDYLGQNAQGDYESLFFSTLTFIDQRDQMKADVVELPDGTTFHNVYGDRITAHGMYDGLVPSDETLPASGEVEWKMANGMFVVYNTEVNLGPAYYRVGDTGLVLEFPYEDTQYHTVDALTAYGQTLFDLFKTACADIGLEAE